MDSMIPLIGLAVVAVAAGMVAASNSRKGDSPRRREASVKPEDAEIQIRRLSGQGEKIEAIKRVREIYGVGLKEAKDLVEAMEAGHAIEPPIPRAAPPAVDDGAVMALIGRQKLIEAIKLVREQHPEMGLKAAKDYVERLQGRPGD